MSAALRKGDVVVRLPCWLLVSCLGQMLRARLLAGGEYGQERILGKRGEEVGFRGVLGYGGLE